MNNIIGSKFTDMIHDNLIKPEDKPKSEKTVKRFATYARNVWGIAEADDYMAANAGIDATQAFSS